MTQDEQLMMLVLIYVIGMGAIGLYLFKLLFPRKP